MLDLYNFLNRPGTDVQIFNRLVSATDTQWGRWQKPRGFGFAYIYAVAGGGGGGGGFTRAAGLAGGGGGGGGSACGASLIVPLDFLPDTLFVSVGMGGLGGAAGVGGGGGGNSRVLIGPEGGPMQDRLLVATVGLAAGGTAGTGAAVGTGGNSGTPGAAVNMPLGYALGFAITHFNGQNGSNGGAVAGGAGINVSFPTSGGRTMGGTGGGGTTSGNFPGGSINAVAGTRLSEMRQAATVAAGEHGSGSYPTMKPFWGFPGFGGSSSNASAGGNGGNGLWGCGGGGGGAGTTGGRGGDGGDGIVIIICF